MRFTITCLTEREAVIGIKRCESIVEAWNHYAYFTSMHPYAEVEIFDKRGEL